MAGVVLFCGSMIDVETKRAIYVEAIRREAGSLALRFPEPNREMLEEDIVAQGVTGRVHITFYLTDRDRSPEVRVHRRWLLGLYKRVPLRELERRVGRSVQFPADLDVNPQKYFAVCCSIASLVQDYALGRLADGSGHGRG